ncbi:MAG: hypothetical protein J6N72_03940 [Psychrobacter sp.]|nr:hypothetical protein [Psychrobacter sp.]
MNFERALAYARDNRKSLEKSRTSILGLMYTPDDEEADFYILNLSSTHASDRMNTSKTCNEGGDVCDSYDCYLQGGSIEGQHTVHRYCSGNSLVELANNLPEFATQINYAAYTPKRDISDLLIVDALIEIFPELKDAYNTENHSQVKATAIQLIENLNACFG